MLSSPRGGKKSDTSRVARQHDASPCSELKDYHLPLGAVAQRRQALHGSGENNRTIGRPKVNELIHQLINGLIH